MPKDAAVVDGMKVSRLNVNSKAEIEKAFGDIEYTKPGTYEYQITEKDPGDTAKQGVTYSNASYRVTVKVTDENGSLKANATMKKIRKDDGSEVANPTAVDNKTAAFANVYDAKEQTVTLGAGKEFTDSTGTKTLKDGDYKFRLTPVTEGAPLPDGASGHVDASNIGNGVKFGNITSTAEHAKGATQDKPLTYEYKMKEILPEGATASNHYTVDGLTYDNAEYKVRINVYIDDVDGQDTVVADYKYLDADGNWNEIENGEGFGVKLNQYNKTIFAPVTTTAIRMWMKPKTLGCGVIEWKVYGYSNEMAADKQLLKAALDKAKSVDTSLFEEGADATLSAAIEEAQAVYDNKEATQDEVDAAAAKLERVIASLPAKDGNLAFSATASTSFVSGWEKLSGINDGLIPENSYNPGIARYGTWCNTSKSETLTYTWGSEVTLKAVIFTSGMMVQKLTTVESIFQLLMYMNIWMKMETGKKYQMQVLII